jgi:hypothetical protein
MRRVENWGNDVDKSHEFKTFYVSLLRTNEPARRAGPCKRVSTREEKTRTKRRPNLRSEGSEEALFAEILVAI